MLPYFCRDFQMSIVCSELSLGQDLSIDFVCRSKQTLMENTNKTQQDSEKESPRSKELGRVLKTSELDSPDGWDLAHGKAGGGCSDGRISQRKGTQGLGGVVKGLCVVCSGPCLEQGTFSRAGMAARAGLKKFILGFLIFLSTPYHETFL